MTYIHQTISDLKRTSPAQCEFYQAVEEVLDSIEPLLEALSGKVVVVHYAAIERHFLNNALLLRLKEGIEFALVDTIGLPTLLHKSATNG